MTTARIQRVPLRDVWPHEARDFTTWLEDNLDVLAEVVGLTMTAAERERAVGDFSADLVVQDDSNRTVVIENQLEKSDHDHLGKILTYTASVEAKAAVWIVARPRPEHVATVSWLNEETSVDFFLVQVEAVRIADSPPAPLLTLIVGPSPEARSAGKTKKELSEKHRVHLEFWQRLLDWAAPRTRLHTGVSPARANWLSAGAGRTGFQWVYTIRDHDGFVELYVHTGDVDRNLAILASLTESRSAVEARVGEALHWDAMPGLKACRVRRHMTGGGIKDEDNWEETIIGMVEAMITLEAALREPLQALELP